MLLGLLAVPALVGLAVYLVQVSQLRRLERGRSLVGTRAGGDFLAELVRRQPQSAEAHFLRGRHLRLEENHVEALAELDRAAQLGWPQEQVERERLFSAAAVSYPQALDGLNRLLDANPDDRDALLVSAAGSIRLNRLERAEVLLTRILSANPDDSEALSLRGRVLLRQGHPNRARADLERAMRTGADQLHEGATRLSLANCLLALGNFEEALALYRRCLDADPHDPVALFGLGRTAIHLDQWDVAEGAMEAVLQTHPDHPDTLLELARISERRGDLTRTLELLRRAEARAADRPEVLTLMAKVLRLTGQTEEAERYAARYTEQQKRNARRPTQQEAGFDARDLLTIPRNPLER